MRLYVCKDYEALSKKAALIVAAQVNTKPESVLGLATGSSPVGMYKELIKLCKEGSVDFSKVCSYNLDEYFPIEPTNDQSYRYFMNENLFYGINIPLDCTHVPKGNAADIKKEAADYDRAVANAGGIDLQVLGIGGNGHIGFNEPTDTFILPTHVVDLKEDTIKANARFFASIDDVPKRAISMGIGTIFAAHSIVLIASGKAKAKAIKDTLEANVNPQVPASILQLHQNVYVVIDEEAASLLNEYKPE
ncbi:MAG: glucosamine-6-phosphate deaminase [Clostridiales bacterium GWF2_38_85]|nr:MAG: glucosamine-6-phosphate deaminase [Clostridiales bacterium GWF2_38_85]HBL83596.1 glucosamine-6-phosphate deaminase [Clostridiales bacterium]